MKAIPPHLSQTPEEAYRKMKYAGTHVATRDPKRPEYHFHSAGQWMDDPNGSVYHNGYYHIMYGANPDSDSNRGGMPYKTATLYTGSICLSPFFRIQKRTNSSSGGAAPE